MKKKIGKIELIEQNGQQIILNVICIFNSKELNRFNHSLKSLELKLK